MSAIVDELVAVGKFAETVMNDPIYRRSLIGGVVGSVFGWLAYPYVTLGPMGIFTAAVGGGMIGSTVGGALVSARLGLTSSSEDPRLKLPYFVGVPLFFAWFIATNVGGALVFNEREIKGGTAKGKPGTECIGAKPSSSNAPAVGTAKDTGPGEIHTQNGRLLITFMDNNSKKPQGVERKSEPVRITGK